MEEAGTWDRTHLQQLPIAVFVVDVDTWCVQETNADGERLLGVSRDSIVGGSFTRHAAGQTGPIEATLEELAAMDGRGRRRELADGGRIFLDGPAGNEVPVELRARRLTR